MDKLMSAQEEDAVDLPADGPRYSPMPPDVEPIDPDGINTIMLYAEDLSRDPEPQPDELPDYDPDPADDELWDEFDEPSEEEIRVVCDVEEKNEDDSMWSNFMDIEFLLDGKLLDMSYLASTTL